MATGYEAAVPALKSLGDLSGKVVVDITNPLTADYMGLTIGHSTSCGGGDRQGPCPAHGSSRPSTQCLHRCWVKGHGHWCRIVRSKVFVASDNAEAKASVTSLAESMGFATQDAGGLKNARYLEPLAGLNIYLGYGAGLGTQMAPDWIQKN